MLQAVRRKGLLTCGQTWQRCCGAAQAAAGMHEVAANAYNSIHVPSLLPETIKVGI
jgi:hypothetical protein